MIIGHYFVKLLKNAVVDQRFFQKTFCVNQADISASAKMKIYPDGSFSITAADREIFRKPGWEACKKRPGYSPREDIPEEVRAADNLSRSRRRATAALRDLAFSNRDFKYFVTLTVADQVERYDVAAMTRHLKIWLDNRVRRDGLKYVLVPELHKDGAIHYHGFFNDALPVVYSGTMIPPEGGKPRRPRTEKRMREWMENGGHIVYNLPDWDYGFTTAIELYGDYQGAVSYVCKYIGKTTEKVGGRWYYSGGKLKRPDVVYGHYPIENLAAEGCAIFEVPAIACRMAYKFTDLSEEDEP